jgi:hypothetical protein
MNFSFVETPFAESSQLIALPVILYILKDNESIKSLCLNSQLEIALLLSSVLISKTNFQASVYLMLTFIMIRLLGNCNNSSVTEEFKGISDDDTNETADLSQAFTYDQKGSTDEVIPQSNNLYMQNINDIEPSEEASTEPSAEPSAEPDEQLQVEGFNSDFDNYQSF